MRYIHLLTYSFIPITFPYSQPQFTCITNSVIFIMFIFLNIPEITAMVNGVYLSHSNYEDDKTGTLVGFTPSFLVSIHTFSRTFSIIIMLRLLL